MTDVTFDDLAADSGASLVGFIQNGTGAVTRTVEEKLRAWITPEDFGATGDGVTDDTDAINDAIAFALANPETTLVFQNTTYLVGSASLHGDSLFTLDGADGFTMRGRPEFVVTDTNDKQVTLFDIQMSDVDIEYIGSTGDAWTAESIPAALVKGLITCMVRSPGGTLLTNHRFGEVRATNGWGAMLYDANTKTYGRADGVTVGLIEATNCIYGFNGASSPNNHSVGQIIADNVFRSYFIYGLKNGRANLFVKPTYTGIFAQGTCANIAVYTESSHGAYATRVGDTRNIEVNIHNTSDRPSLQLSTNSMDPTDDCQGHYNIRANVMSSTGTALKVSNADSTTTNENKTTPYASPKRNITVRAHLAQDFGCLDTNSYGLWSDGEGLLLECSNFLDSNLTARQSYLESGWQVRDLFFGYEIPRVLAVGAAGATSFLKAAFNEDPHLSLGDDATNNTRYRAGSAHAWFLGGALHAYLNAAAFQPWNDNALTLGASARRWSTVYAATGTINTSDARDKQDVAVLDAAEKRVAAAIRGLVKKYRFRDAVAAKGEVARIHVGVVAQEVIAAFEGEGLDARRYGILCHDSWDAEGETPAGERFGIRYDELLAFVIASL